MKKITLKDNCQITYEPDKFSSNWGNKGWVAFTPKQTIDVEDKIIGSHYKNRELPSKDIPVVGDILINKNGDKFEITGLGGFITGINAWFKIKKI